VKIAIRDSAPAFNPLTIPPPDITADLADRVAGGMGIFLIRKVMDGVSYEYVEGQNVLTMEKKLGNEEN
jgi:anti-sigma regulatory factor (Ser/Thr protein kinase)